MGNTGNEKRRTPRTSVFSMKKSGKTLRSDRDGAFIRTLIGTLTFFQDHKKHGLEIRLTTTPLQAHEPSPRLNEKILVISDPMDSTFSTRRTFQEAFKQYKKWEQGGSVPDPITVQVNEGIVHAFFIGEAEKQSTNE
jgi:hypothetical protein